MFLSIFISYISSSLSSSLSLQFTKLKHSLTHRVFRFLGPSAISFDFTFCFQFSFCFFFICLIEFCVQNVPADTLPCIVLIASMRAWVVGSKSGTLPPFSYSSHLLLKDLKHNSQFVWSGGPVFGVGVGLRVWQI